MTKRFKNVFLSIGSNLGNRINNLDSAKFQLNNSEIVILKSSSIFESLSWPDPSKPKFLNTIIKIKTKLLPKKLYNICSKIEFNLGRRRSIKNSPRTCDIDIIDYNLEVSNKDLILPHPLMSKRNFVLLPLYEIDKSWKHPVTALKIEELLFSLPVRDLRSIKQI